jgi:hypothetical protein
MSLLLEIAKWFSFCLLHDRQSAPPIHGILMTGLGTSESQINRFESCDVLAIRFAFSGDHLASLDFNK